MRCDGCGDEASDQHIRQRIERLELATRFRPIHLNVLILAAAPPRRLADYFYCPAKNPEDRSMWGRAFFASMMVAAGLPDGAWKDEEAALVEFQRRGFFLAYSRECPFEMTDQNVSERDADVGETEFARSYGPTVVQRVKFSYKPKRIVLLGSENTGLIPLLERAGLKDSLVLDSSRVFLDPSSGDLLPPKEFLGSLGPRLAKALGTVPDPSVLA